MHDQCMGDTYFISQFIGGLKPEVRYAVQGQVLATMERAVMLAKLQKQIQQNRKGRHAKSFGTAKFTSSNGVKSDPIKPPFTPQLFKERQLRDFCIANNLCLLKSRW